MATGIGITISIIATMVTTITGMTIVVGRVGSMVGTIAMVIIGSAGFVAKVGSWCRCPSRRFMYNRPRW